MTATTEGVRAHLAATYATGNSAEDMTAVPLMLCECGDILDPLLGKLHGGTRICWDVWIAGNYEHRHRPVTPHLPQPVREATVWDEQDAAERAFRAREDEPITEAERGDLAIRADLVAEWREEDLSWLEQ